MEIKAGVELDRAVADACGWAGVESPHDPPRCWVPVFEKKVMEDFSPSTDLNVAFEAAERVKLFTGDETYSLWANCSPRGDRYWAVVDWYEAEREKDPADGEFARGDTPALAICAAILKLREVGDGGS